jgi:hypothetical protein
MIFLPILVSEHFKSKRVAICASQNRVRFSLIKEIRKLTILLSEWAAHSADFTAQPQALLL